MAGAAQPKLTSEYVISTLKFLYGEDLDCSKVVYKNSLTSIDLVCKHHGPFSVLPVNALRGKFGCKKCRYNKVANSMKSCEKDFEIRGIQRYGTKYNYSKVEYVNSDTKVIIGCPVHADFETTPYRHLTGGGCPKCASYGYNTGKPGTFYILQDGLITKVGITNRLVRTRLKEVNKSGTKNFKVMTALLFENGEYASKLESEVLRYLAEHYQSVTEIFDGSTECFLNVDLATLINFVTPLATTTELQSSLNSNSTKGK